MSRDIRILRAEIVSKDTLHEDARRYIELLDSIPSLTDEPLYTCEIWGEDGIMITVNMLRGVELLINFYKDGKFSSIYGNFGDGHQAVFENGLDEDDEEDDLAYETFAKFANDYRDAVEQLINSVPYDIG